MKFEIGDIVEIKAEANSFWAGLGVITKIYENRFDDETDKDLFVVTPITGKAKNIMGIGQGGFVESALKGPLHGYVHVNREMADSMPDYVRHAL